MGHGEGLRQGSDHNDRNEDTMEQQQGFTRLGDDLTLPGGHPLAGRKAWQCEVCRGIFYPENDESVECPYCSAATQLEITLAISKAQRKLNGAWYDLTRLDRHPNDRHKALAKVDEAIALLASIPRETGAAAVEE